MISLYLVDLVDFFQRGGVVLCIIFAVCFVLWYFLLQRYFFVKFCFNKQEKELINSMQKRDYDKKFSSYVRQYFMSKIRLDLKKNLYHVETLIVISPLVGLLGTVTGMIEIFDTLSYNGSSDIKLMASGISMATIPTMAGMVVALSGILFKKRIDVLIKDKMHSLFLSGSRIFS